MFEKSVKTHFCHLQTHYITKTEVLAVDGSKYCQAGEMSKLKFNVKCIENSVDQDQLLFYEVVCDSNNWAPAGKTSGMVQCKKKHPRKQMKE